MHCRDEPSALRSEPGAQVWEEVAQLHAGVEKEDAAEARHGIEHDAGLPGVVAKVSDVRRKLVKHKRHNDHAVDVGAHHVQLPLRQAEVVDEDGRVGLIVVQAADEIHERQKVLR
jgi:hypothetical protein